MWRTARVSIEERRASLAWAKMSTMPTSPYDMADFITPAAMPPSVNPSAGALRGYYAWVRTQENIVGITAEEALGITPAQMYAHTGCTPPAAGSASAGAAGASQPPTGGGAMTRARAVGAASPRLP
jgi:hypothetical protein